MNNKFILPAAFALTVHAFLLFGLTGRPPPAAVASVSSTPTEAPPLVPVDPEYAPHEKADPDDKPTSGGLSDPLPRLAEYVPIPAPPGAPTVPVLPQVVGMHPTTVITSHWEESEGAGRDRTDVIDLSKLDRVPRARSQPAPVYPTDLRHDGIEGTVVVEFKVDLEGNVYNVAVVHATHPGFIDAALRAVGRWKFEPGRRGNTKVRFRMSVPVVFSIEDR
jgi:periplasmic protein TonB